MSSSILKKLGVVAIVLVLLWIVYLYRQVPHNASPFTKAIEKTEEVTLEKGSVKIILRKESDHWKVGSSAGKFFAADQTLVKTLLSGLKDVQVEDQISDRADRAAEYEVDPENGLHVGLLDAKETKLAEGVFGKEAPDSNHIYFKYVDKPDVYLAGNLIRGELGEAEVNKWRSRKLIDLPEAAIQEVMIRQKGLTTDLVRKDTDTWTLNGKVIDPSPVYKMVGALSHLTADEFVAPSTAPVLAYDSLQYAQITAKTANQTVELRIGPEWIQQQKYPAAVSPDDGLVWLYPLHVNPLLLKSSDFHFK